MNVLIPPPSTPQVIPAPTSLPAPPPSPGTWRHPKFTEIVSRRNASTFSDQNFKRAAVNLIALFISFAFSSEFHATLKTVLQTIPNLSRQIQPTATYTTYTLITLRLYFLLNLSLALLPLLPSRANDPISDIPLTPSQRALMGLAPTPLPSKRKPKQAAPSTPGSSNSLTASFPTYITPPRYKRTSFSPSQSPSAAGSNNALGPSTPSSGRSISANYSSSPLSGRGAAPSPNSTFRSLSTSINRLTNHSNSPFSPNNRSSSGSPLLQKALASNNNNNHDRDNEAAFRSSFSPSTPASGLRRSQSVREGVGVRSPGSGSANGHGSRGRSPAVNYKWLYEKEKRTQVRGGGVGLLSRSESIKF